MSRGAVWAEINLDAIEYNTRQLINIIRDSTALMAVVKANAYGHGVVPVARAALASGASWLGVARASEGAQLRREGIDAPILVLGYTPPEEYPVLLTYDLAQTVYCLPMAAELSATAARYGKKAIVHIKVDTGMGRLGFPYNRDTVREITAVAALPHLEVEGIFTHFAAADCRDKRYTKQQWMKFTKLLSTLDREGLVFEWKHAANSAALIDLPETHLNMVRAGIAMYGIYPSNEVNTHRVSLLPAMSLKARVAHVKKVPAGSGISYGVTHITTRDTIVVTVPVGYADGYNRLLSSRGEVLICGRRAPVIGRICMDQFMVDAGHIPEVEPGDEVVLMGCQGAEKITAEEIAAKIDTIAYEVLCMVSSRVPRIYYQEAK